MMLRRWGPWDGSGMWSLSVNPAVSLDCSILVDGESPQNRGTQNVTSVLKEPTVFWDIVSREKALKGETKPGLWPPNCLSYRVLEAIAPEYRGEKAGVRLELEGGGASTAERQGEKFYWSVWMSYCPHALSGPTFKLSSHFPPGTHSQVSFTLDKALGLAGGPGCHGFRLAELQVGALRIYPRDLK